MKILLVNKYHYFKGGSETYYFGLAQLLKARGHEVIFFSMQDEHNEACEQEKYFIPNVDFNNEASAVRRIRSGLRLIYSFGAKRRIAKLLDAEKPDVVHISLFHRTLTPSILDAIKARDIPIVFTMHDLNCLCPNHMMLANGEICEDCLDGKYLNCFRKKCIKDSGFKSLLGACEAYLHKMRNVYNLIDLYIAPTFFYKELLEESEITKSPVVHMKNFLPLGTEYGPCGIYGNYFLFFGRLSVEKGILTMLKAYENSGTSMPLYIAGTGEMEEEIKRFVSWHDLGDRVFLLGFKSGGELREIIRNSRCVILAAQWYENGSYSVMEAGAMGKPVIVSDCGGLPERVENGVTGFIVKPFDVDSLSRAIRMMEILPVMVYYEMARAATQKARNEFDPHLYADRLIALYEGLLNRGAV